MIKYIYFILIISISFTKGVKIMFDPSSTISYKGFHPAHDWIGESNNFKGGIICDDNSFNECFIKVAIPLNSFDSKNSGRDSNMLLYTESNKYPYVKFISKQFSISDSFSESLNLSGELEFHGIKNNLSTEINLSVQDSIIVGLTKFTISLEDYKVDRPELLFIPISDEVEISCRLTCSNSLGVLQNEKR